MEKLSNNLIEQLTEWFMMLFYDPSYFYEAPNKTIAKEKIQKSIGKLKSTFMVKTERKQYSTLTWNTFRENLSLRFQHIHFSTILQRNMLAFFGE